ncbi:hypothetical protein ACFOSC_27890 [Streptantibioticus rubrisoli]|uniref:Uncharacterized protein n=1 Tax=Streptantibioticus rubrisoli TaxID=1387313 RepID=A0ABT1PLZ2_9ACTN|nr:hypothetical protein [Streptantibioticus rubrisoli]MCQ4045826.1 hypothetical protein [Streptantibioticus rubrisoli]
MNNDPQRTVDPWNSAPPAPTEPTFEQQMTDYDRTLDAAGYGSQQREQYIADSAEDPEYAACQWDEMIVTAAEAAGEIPARPVEPSSPVEQAQDAARQHAMTEYWHQHPVEQGGWDPFSNDPEKEQHFTAFVSARSTQILQDIGVELADRIETAGTWGENTVAEVYQATTAPEIEAAGGDLDIDI